MEENGSMDDVMHDCVVPANFDELLTEQVRIQPSLYNPQDKHFKNPLKKEDIWNRIADSLDVSVELCCSRWRTLRERYVKKKKTISEYPETADRIMDHWPLFATIEDFLSPYISHRKKVLYSAPKSVHMEEKIDSGSETVDSLYASTTNSNSVNSTSKDNSGKSGKMHKQNSTLGPKRRLKRLQQAGWKPVHNSNNSSHDVSVAALRALTSMQKPSEEDEEGHFGHIVAATLRRLPPRQRAQTKLVIYQILVDSEFPPVVESSAPQPTMTGGQEDEEILPRNFSISETSDDIVYDQVKREDPA